MKKLIVSLLLMVFFHFCNAQRKQIDSLLGVINNVPDSTQMHISYQLAKNYINISNDSVGIYAGSAIRLAKQLHDHREEARAYSLLGVAEKNRGNYKKAITYHLQSLRIYEADNDQKDIATAYNDIGIIYKNMKNWDAALGYYKKSNEICRKINLSAGISMTYNNIGTIMKEKGYNDSALINYNLALAEAKKTGDTYSISTCLSNIGEVYVFNKKYNEALAIFTQCLQYDKLNEDKYGMLMSYMNIANASNRLKLYPQALTYTDSAYKICVDEKLPRELLDALITKVEIEKNMGHIDAAFALQSSYIVLKDSLLNEETSKQIVTLQTQYETARKEKEISYLKQQQQIRNYQILAIGGIMILLSVIAGLLYSRQRFKQRQAKEKAVLNAEYRERLRIAKDVHDDLGSGLSKISLMAEMAKQRDGNTVTGNEIVHISTMSKELVENMRDLIWVLNPENTTLDNLAARIREYCTDYLEGMPVKTVLDFPHDVMPLNISRDAQRNIFLTVKEAVHNCIKHANAGTLAVTLAIDNLQLSITITDNGKGFDEKDIRRGNGLRNMQQRIESIGGLYVVNGVIGNGTSVAITVPLSKLAVNKKNTTLM